MNAHEAVSIAADGLDALALRLCDVPDASGALNEASAILRDSASRLALPEPLRAEPTDPAPETTKARGKARKGR